MLAEGDSINFPKFGQRVVFHSEISLDDGQKICNNTITRMHTVGDAWNGISGLNDGLMFLTKGARAKITIPPEKAFGTAGKTADDVFLADIPPNATLIFTILLTFIIPE